MVAPAVHVKVRASGLAECRCARGLTQRQLAALVGVSQNYIPALEGGSREPGPKLRAQLTDVLGIGFFDLFEVVLMGLNGAELRLRPGGEAPRPPLATADRPAHRSGRGVGEGPQRRPR
jgi:transcriptional regulator with XRE-family HTH domain